MHDKVIQFSNRGRGRRSRRAPVVEFAIVAPIFFLFLMAAFEFGWLNVLRHTADNAAYEAARTRSCPARRPPKPSPKPTRS